MADLLRKAGYNAVHVLAAVILANLRELADPLAAGCIVTFEPTRLRIHPLPIWS